MNYQALVDFNKYTLALSAACIVYTLEKYTPQSTIEGRNYVLYLLIVLVVSAITGVLVFSAATSAQHATAEGEKRLKNPIEFIGFCHATFLIIGLLGLSMLIFNDALVVKDNVLKSQCIECCKIKQ